MPNQPTKSETTSENASFLGSHWKKTLEVAGIILLIAGTVLGMRAWIEDRIDKAMERKLSDETILRRIAAQSRPAIFFNSSESIIADLGAGQMVKDIKIVQRSGDGWPEEILVDFTKHLSNPPILTTMNDLTVVTPKRAKGFAWQFHVSQIVSHQDDKKFWHYRLEIVP